MMITIISEAFTIADMRADWADDESLTGAQVSACADAEYAYLVNEVGDKMRGWSFEGRGAFTGPARLDAISLIGELKIAAVDWVIEHLEEIKAEADES